VREAIAQLGKENQRLRDQLRDVERDRVTLVERLDAAERALSRIDEARTQEASTLADMSRTIDQLSGALDDLQRAPAARLGRAVRAPVQTLRRRLERTSESDGNQPAGDDDY